MRSTLTTAKQGADLGGLDLAMASYGVAMFGSAEAGEIDFNLPSKDTDTRDPNAIDIVVSEWQTQAGMMDWQTNSPVLLPMIRPQVLANAAVRAAVTRRHDVLAGALRTGS